MKVLLVDDNLDNLSLMRYALLEYNYDLFLATSGREAIEITEREEPDLILLDVMMPEMDGFETCKKIHSNDKYKNIPIIMVTAKSDLKDLTKGFKSGAIDYIKKPYNNLELSTRVKSALRLKKMTDELIKEKQKTALIEMAAAVAHNLNQPLSGMILNVQYIQTLLDGDGIDKDEINKKIEVLIQLVDTMSVMIKKIGQITNYYTMPYIKDLKIIDIDKSSV